MLSVHFRIYESVKELLLHSWLMARVICVSLPVRFVLKANFLLHISLSYLRLINRMCTCEMIQYKLMHKSNLVPANVSAKEAAAKAKTEAKQKK